MHLEKLSVNKELLIGVLVGLHDLHRIQVSMESSIGFGTSLFSEEIGAGCSSTCIYIVV